jgi:uroporphyrinogen decarboxylase
MTSRERVLTAVAHRQPDRAPRTVPMAPEVRERLGKYLGLNEVGLTRWLDEDIALVHPTFQGPASPHAYADPTIEVTPDGLYLDIYRVPFRAVRAGGQVYMELAGRPPLASCRSLPDLARHPWPMAAMWDYTTVFGDLAAAGDKAIRAHSRGFFEIAHFMRGMDPFLADLAADPPMACALMDRISDYLLDRSRRVLEAGQGRYDIFEYNDDVAAQRALFISPAMWRERVRPRMARFCDLAHEFGARLRYHCCGSVRAIIPDLIEIGVDILNPIQPLAVGMDPFDLKREFGRDLTFDGGIDIQQLLPHATPSEVRAHVRRMIDQVGASGGYILGPSHSIQSDVPLANIVAMVEEGNR